MRSRRAAVLILVLSLAAAAPAAAQGDRPGPADLRALGVRRVADLRRRDPERLYTRLNQLRGARQDPRLYLVDLDAPEGRRAAAGRKLGVSPSDAGPGRIRAAVGCRGPSLGGLSSRLGRG